MAISHSRGRCRGKGERISDREKELPSKSCACHVYAACIETSQGHQARTAERHAIRIVPQVQTPTTIGSIRLWFRPAQACTRIPRIHTQTLPCHAIQTIHPTQSITVNPSRPFLARPDRPHSCSRLAAAATAHADRQTDRQTTSSNGKPPARTARHVKNLISLAPSVSSLFISYCSHSPSLFPFLGSGDAPPVFYFALLSKPYRQAGGQSVSQSGSQSIGQAILRVDRLPSPTASRVSRNPTAGWHMRPLRTGRCCSSCFCHTTAATAGLRRPLGLSSSVSAAQRVHPHVPSPYGHEIGASTGQAWSV